MIHFIPSVNDDSFSTFNETTENLLHAIKKNPNKHRENKNRVKKYMNVIITQISTVRSVEMQ